MESTAAQCANVKPRSCVLAVKRPGTAAPSVSSPRGELTTGNVTKISVLSSLQVPYLFTASPLHDSTRGIFFLDISATDSSTDRLMYLLHLVILEKNECVSKKNWLKQ